VVAASLCFVAPAGASQLIARNASKISLGVDAKGTALVTYTYRGRVTHLLAWGAVNARSRPASSRVRQVKLRLDYSGGWRGHMSWKRFRNACRPYHGPELPWLVSACKASNGSYWALQSWQTALPNLGMAPWLAPQKTWWLHLSHWTGPLAQLEVHADWIYSGRYQELFGRYTYRASAFAASGPRSSARPRTGSGGCSSSTRTTRRTGRAGCARTRSSRTGRPGCSVTASTGGTRGSAATRILRGCRSTGAGPGPGSGTGSRRRGPASRPT
jgi:hypothetical protein